MTVRRSTAANNLWIDGRGPNVDLLGAVRLEPQWQRPLVRDNSDRDPELTCVDAISPQQVERTDRHSRECLACCRRYRRRAGSLRWLDNAGRNRRSARRFGRYQRSWVARCRSRTAVSSPGRIGANYDCKYFATEQSISLNQARGNSSLKRCKMRALH